MQTQPHAPFAIGILILGAIILFITQTYKLSNPSWNKYRLAHAIGWIISAFGMPAPFSLYFLAWAINQIAYSTNNICYQHLYESVAWILIGASLITSTPQPTFALAILVWVWAGTHILIAIHAQSENNKNKNHQNVQQQTATTTEVTQQLKQ